MSRAAPGTASPLTPEPSILPELARDELRREDRQPERQRRGRRTRSSRYGMGYRYGG